MLDEPEASTVRATRSGLSANEVILAYRLFLDREPESPEVVAIHVAHHKNLKALRAAMLKSMEFRRKLPAALSVPATKPLNWPAIKVDVDVTTEQLAEMVRLVEGNWEALGRSEPHWSVLTSDQFKSAKIQETEEQFYQSGMESLELVTSATARCGVDVAALKTCLELGCGVGRVTVWLAKLFHSVVGVDISRPHLALAEVAAQRHAALNISFTHINSLQSLRDLPHFDCLFSVIVLQHNPPPVIYAILDTLLPKLNPGGVAYFQLPTYRLGYLFEASTYLANAAIRGKMEMHVLPQPVLFSLYAKHDCRVLEAREDGKAGSPLIVSNSFLIQKQA
jgi:2-polyprenyl-3-methyl-5-hydroxy-6-metoxy-1,4-benzoquinol methylase